MAVKLTGRQQEVMKSMVEYAEVFADQIYEIMKNHGLNYIDGCRLDISVDPQCIFTTEVVMFGRGNKDSGHIYLTKGRRSKHERFIPTGKNSPEYERLFMEETVRTATEAGNDNEKPLPPDGLWIGDPRNDYPVGSWEWDVNDSLS